MATERSRSPRDRGALRHPRRGGSGRSSGESARRRQRPPRRSARGSCRRGCGRADGYPRAAAGPCLRFRSLVAATWGPPSSALSAGASTFPAGTRARLILVGASGGKIDQKHPTIAQPLRPTVFGRQILSQNVPGFAQSRRTRRQEVQTGWRCVAEKADHLHRLSMPSSDDLSRLLPRWVVEHKTSCDRRCRDETAFVPATQGYRLRAILS